MRALAPVILVACGGGTATAPVVTNTSSTPPAMSRPALDDADCQAFGAAAAYGMAVVASATPDCSGIGNLRLVLDVSQLARGSGIRTLVARQPLGARPQLRPGDILVTTIEPQAGGAETVSCVPLPAHEGLARHWVRVESRAAGQELLDALVAGRACPPPR